MAPNPNEVKKERIMDEFAGLMPMLRTRLGLTQEQLAQRVGTTRQTVIAIESNKRKLTWQMFLSLVFVFYLDARTRPFLIASGIISEELSGMLLGDALALEKTSSMLESGSPMLARAREMMDSFRKPMDKDQE